MKYTLVSICFNFIYLINYLYWLNLHYLGFIRTARFWVQFRLSQ
jgi:hypothetical protein